MIRRPAAVVALVVASWVHPGDRVRPAGPHRGTYGPGGAADTLARLFADVLSTALGDSSTSRTGRAAASSAARWWRGRRPTAPRSRFRISTHVLAPAMNRSAGFDPMRDFTHVAYLGGAPNMFVVHPAFARIHLPSQRAPKPRRMGCSTCRPASAASAIWWPNICRQGKHRAHARGLSRRRRARRPRRRACEDRHDELFHRGRARARGKLMPLAVSSAARLKDFPDVPTLTSWAIPTSSPPPGGRSRRRLACRGTSPRKSIARSPRVSTCHRCGGSSPRMRWRQRS